MLRRCVWSRNIKNGCSIYIYIYIYIYDISSLRVTERQIARCTLSFSHISIAHVTSHAPSSPVLWLNFFCNCFRWYQNTARLVMTTDLSHILWWNCTEKCWELPLRQAIQTVAIFILIYFNTMYHALDLHGFVHHNGNLIEMTNKMQLCRTVYYSIVPWPLNMFRAILSLIIRSF